VIALRFIVTLGVPLVFLLIEIIPSELIVLLQGRKVPVGYTGTSFASEAAYPGSERQCWQTYSSWPLRVRT
jgi:hypothetical protein